MYATLFRSEAANPMRTNLAAVILRLSLAVVFLFHGMDKIIHGSAGAAWVTVMYERMPALQETQPESQRKPEQVPISMSFLGTQLAVAWGEFLGGLALAAGMLTRLAALGLIVIQVGAVILVTAPRGFSFAAGGGYEYNLTLIAVCLALLILGPGKWSVDWLLVQQRAKKVRRAEIPVASPVSEPHAVPSGATEQVTPGASS